MLQMGDVYSIRRLHYVQKWGIRRISRELGYSRKAVRRAIAGEHDGQYAMSAPRNQPVIGPFVPLIRGLLAQEVAEEVWHKQRWTAAGIHRLLLEKHEYTGSEATVRRAVRELRAEIGVPAREAFVPLEYDPGEDGQVDFFCADAVIAQERQRLTFLLMRACFSTRPFVCRVPAENSEALLESMAAGFAYFGGVFHSLWFDNLTAAVARVLQSRSRVVRQPFEDFRLFYGFRAEFCAPSKGNEKGKVENGVRHTRRSGLVPMPNVSSLADLDRHLAAWMQREDRRRPSRSDESIGELWGLEVPRLLPLPAAAFDVGRPERRKVSRCGLVRVDTNDYSVPVGLVDAHVTVKRYAERMVVHGPSGVVAEHPRLYGRDGSSLLLDHYLPLLRLKARAFDRAAPVRRARAQWPPAYDELLRLLRQRLGDAGGTRDFIDVLLLHRQHEAVSVHDAVREAVTHEQPSSAVVRAYLDLRRRQADPPETMTADTLARYPAVTVTESAVVDYNRLCPSGAP